MSGAALWPGINRRQLARMISELAWEEVLHPTGSLRFELALKSGVTYHFAAIRRIWDNLDIEPESITRNGAAASSALQFAIDARAEMAMSPAIEASFLRELSNTLSQDLFLAERYGALTTDELIAQPAAFIHAVLEGHPKAVANKGRLGWGLDDNAALSPEAARPIRLQWIAADRAHLRTGGLEPVEEHGLIRNAIGAAEASRLEQALVAAGVSFATHALMPVHPWQWDHHLAQAFIAERMEGRIIDLGTFGPDFLATPSLRTLTPTGDEPFDVKLALGILNTSAWRGMPGKYIEHGGAISDWLDTLVASDPLLEARVTVLREVHGQWYRHPLLAQCPDAPYRHHEMLGAIWRDRAETRIGRGRTALMAAALFHRGACGTPLAEAYARAAGVTMEDWLRRLFEVTVVPLWHFLCRYGVGFIAHGQNVTVILEDNLPVGMAIKDFQGDLDLVDRDFPEMAGLSDEIRALLPRKPPAYIVHDIQTAHFVTVLRFLSAALARSGACDERLFYDLLSRTLAEYRRQHPRMEERFRLFELFAEKMPKVCINRVRFAIGYEDSAERPLPARGTDLDNPVRAPELEATAS